MTQNGAAAVAPKTTGPAGPAVDAAASPPSAPATAALGHAGAAAKAPGANEDARWRPVLGLPCSLTVDLPVPEFKICDLLKLRTGSLVDARWHMGHDLPLRLNGTLIGWSKIEVVNNRLAVRLTELA